MEGFAFGSLTGFAVGDKPETCVLDSLNHADISKLNEKQCLILCSQLLKCRGQISANVSGAFDFLFVSALDVVGFH